MSDLRGKNVLITGASRGLGAVIAARLATEGANLVLAARDTAKLEEVRVACETLGVRATAVAADLTDEASLARLVESAESEGPVHVLVNNAGIEHTVSVLDHTTDQIAAEVRTNLLAPLLLTRLLLPRMVERKTGTVVMISSMSGKGPTPWNSVYAATKWGLNGFTASLRIELAGTGVHAGVVCPGFVAGAGMWASTGQKAPAVMREVRPEQVADGVLKVIGGAGEVLVAPGPIRPLLAVQTLFPGLTAPMLRATGITAALQARSMRR